MAHTENETQVPINNKMNEYILAVLRWNVIQQQLKQPGITCILMDKSQNRNLNKSKLRS